MKLARLTAFLSFASLVFSAETVTDTNGQGEYAVQMPQVYDGYEKNLQNCKAMGILSEVNAKGNREILV